MLMSLRAYVLENFNMNKSKMQKWKGEKPIEELKMQNKSFMMLELH